MGLSKVTEEQELKKLTKLEINMGKNWDKFYGVINSKRGRSYRPNRNNKEANYLILGVIQFSTCSQKDIQIIRGNCKNA